MVFDLNRTGRGPVTEDTSTTDTNQGITKIRDTSQKVRCIEEAIQLVCKALMHKISALEMIPMDKMNASSPLTDYGLDLISAIELRNWVMRDMGAATLGLQDILSSPSITDLIWQL
ncbi:hypothetical protein ASPWEDRAFT_166836 [Aspergillus wentii DTO 134E9]|uniref:Carrier domain-containing protein n=1 Tax=Aspergillus wentii DTO 134E9 TaxID=1073089 RepID=A0A1L9S0S5_ASPWE|nr:uncharacterized protein ASPWEDRAFT_166836 [Aspergillus wentii DTO 134E9]KAI9931216.1 hypothetical protein MW887_010877 [Aspergillus wentii]OJJ40775.1 hypothetical protein ASPWEDRAFT_166836 [Aspergillus wentii DTO 134E9]